MRARPLAVVLAVMSLAAFAVAQQTPAAPPPLDGKALGERVDALARPLADSGALVGFVVGVLDGITRVERAYGAVAHGGAAPDSGTLFEIGSASKVFTGVLLADAVTRGRVSLDDAVAKHLPESAEMPTFDGTPVLLWHLATHTSGLPRLPDMTGADEADPYAHFTRDRLLAALPKAKVRWRPGSKYEYSNLGVGLLGEVLVRVNDAASYDALLRERIAAPLGMVDTGVVLDDAHRARLAAPFDGDGEPTHTWDLAALAGAGGIRSTLRDMLAFLQANLHPDAAPALGKALRLAQQERYQPAEGVAMALGWHFNGSHDALWHNGQTGGYHSWIWLDAANGRAICILANTTSGLVDRLGERIAKVLAGKPAEPLAVPAVAAVERAALARCVGVYGQVGGPRLAVELRERGLFARLGDQPWLRLYPTAPTEFTLRAADASISFTVGEGQDHATLLVLHQNGHDQSFPRVETAVR